MLSRRKLGVALAGALAVAVLVVFWPRDEGPLQDGKSLSEWLMCVSWTDPERVQNLPPARVAIRAMGTNSLPYLLSWISIDEKESLDRRAVRWFCERVPGMQKIPVLRHYWLRDDPNEVRAAAVVHAFDFLGPVGEPAIPELERIVANHGSGRRFAMTALALIGPGATPALRSFLQSTNGEIRDFATYNMRYFGTNALALLPTLIERLSDPDETIAVSAAVSLGHLRLEPSITIPALTNTLRDERFIVQGAVLGALGKYGGQARPAVPALVRILRDSESGLRENATNTLLLVAPEILSPASSGSSARAKND